MSSRTKEAVTGLAVLVLLLNGGLSGCGKPDGSQVNQGGSVPVTGSIFFGNQCPLGSVADPRPSHFEMWDCPTAMDRFELAESPKPLYVMVDCAKKGLTVRGIDGKPDTYWLMLPDGTFDASIEKGLAPLVFARDQAGGSSCLSYAKLELHGKADCTDVDRPKVKFDALWVLSPQPYGTNPQDSSRPTCQLPTSCFMSSQIEINQCSI